MLRARRPVIRPRPSTLLLAGVVILAAALPLTYLVASSPAGLVWPGLLEDEALLTKSALWAPVSELGRLAKPVVILLGLVMVVACLRVSRRSTAVLVGVVALSNLTVQGLKRPIAFDAPHLGGLNPLSGHVGLVAAVLLGWLVVAPAALKAVSAVCPVGAIGGVCAGVVLAGWHSPAQVLCCLMICLGWALVGAAAMGQDASDGAVPRWGLPAGGTLGALGALVLTGGLVASRSLTGGSHGATPAHASGIAVAVGVGGSLVAVGVLVGLTSHLGMRRAGHPAAPETFGAGASSAPGVVAAAGAVGEAT